MQTKKILPFVLLLTLLFMPFADSAQAVSAPSSQPVIPAQEGAGTEVSTGVDPGIAGEQIQSLSGSYVAFDPSAGGAASYLPGVSQTLCFRSESFTTDYEYVYNNWLKFPDTWTVSDVFVAGTPSCTNGGGWGTFGWSFTTSPYEINIAHARYQATSDHCTAFYCVVVTPAAAGDPAPVSWYFDGDGYGSAPHNPCSSDLYTPSGQNTCDESVNAPANVPFAGSGLFFAPDEIITSGCHGEQQMHEVHLANFTGAETTVTLDYDAPYGTGFTGPYSLTIPNGTSVSFFVALHPHVCMEDGELTATIEATNGVETATLEIHKEVYSTLEEWQQLATNPSVKMDNVLASFSGKLWQITGYGSAEVSNYDPLTDVWTTIPSSAPPFGPNYARSGCQHGDKVFMYGDSTTPGFTGLWSYNMNTGAWTAETPAGTPPTVTGMWAPAWAYDSEDHLCYLTGGATVSGSGNLASVYVYDPVGNAWLAPLPAFTTPRDFHAAFIYRNPANNLKLLCVAGGNFNNIGLSSTQCFDSAGGSWHLENTDIPALPATLWGMGYAMTNADPGNDLWLVNGVDAAGALFDISWKYNTAAGVWEDMGPLPGPVVYRVSAATLDNMVYITGGSTGGFSPSGITHRFFVEDCEACIVPEIEKDATAVAMPGERITYTLTVPQLPPDFVQVQDYLPEDLAWVPGSLMVTPDIGMYGYSETTRLIYWAYEPPPLRTDQWKPVSIDGPAAEAAGLSVSGNSGSLAGTASPAAQTDSVLLWDQPLSTVNTAAYVNQDFPDSPSSSSFLTDDFVVDTLWNIDGFFLPGDGWNGFSTLLNAYNLTFMIYADDMGVPAGDPSGRGDPPVWGLNIPPTDPHLTITNGTGGMPSNVQLDLDTPIPLPAGHYWFIFYPTMVFNPYGQYGRQPSDTTNGYTGQFVNPGNGFGLGTEWQPWSVIGPTQQDLAFSIYGTEIQSVVITFQADVLAPRMLLTNYAWLYYGDEAEYASASTFTGHGVYLPITLKQ